MALEKRTARLTVLIDPDKKAVFERLCVESDMTPSQMVRHLIRRFITEKLGAPWVPSERAKRAAPASPRKRRQADRAR